MRKGLKSPSSLSAFASITVAILGFMGYLPGLGFLGRVKENYIPMAPSTAFSFLLLGFILLNLNGKKLSSVKVTFLLIGTLLVSLFGILEVAGYFSGMDLNFEDALVPPAGDLHGVPIARMSPATGAAFFLSGFALFILFLHRKFKRRNRYFEYLGSGLGILVLLTSFVFCLAYLYGTPLLYGKGTTIPMALTTALGFLFLAISILSLESDAFPLKLLTGTSTRSYLLRFILPLSTLSVILGGVTVLSSEHSSDMNPAFLSATVTVLIAVITGFLATLISRHMGGQIDRSKAEAKKAHETLRKSENSLKEAQRIANMGSWIWDLKTNIVVWADNLYHIHGIERRDFDGKIETVMSFIHPNDLENVKMQIQQLLNEKNPVEFEYRIIARNGMEKVMRGSQQLTFDSEGNVFQMIGILQDITKQKRAEEALRESEENLRTTLNSIGDAVIATDIHGKIAQINPIAEELTGWKFEESVGRQLTEILNLINVQTQKPAEDPVNNVLTSGQITGSNQNVLISKDGTKYQIAKSGAPIIGADGKITGVVLVFRDVTEQSRMEEKIKTSLIEKELLIRELYHRTKNNMQVISSMLFLQSSYTQNETVKKIFQETKIE